MGQLRVVNGQWLPAADSVDQLSRLGLWLCQQFLDAIRALSTRSNAGEEAVECLVGGMVALNASRVFIDWLIGEVKAAPTCLRGWCLDGGVIMTVR